MRYVVFLSLLVTVYCAPVVEQADEVADAENSLDRVKRAEEIMMFHDEEEDPSDKTKRSGTDFPAEENIDKFGEVWAKEPVDIADAETEENAEASIPASESSEDLDEEAVPSDNGEEGTDSEETHQDEVDGSEEASEVPDVDNNDSEDVEQIPDDSDSETGTYRDALQALHLLPSDDDDEEDTSFQDYLLNYPYNRFNPYAAPFRGYRYKRSQTQQRADILSPRLRAMSRRRMKRDLLYPSEYLNDKYYPHDDNYVDMPFENYQEPNEEDLSYLLDLIDEARGGEANEAEEPFGYAPSYDAYSPYDEVGDYYPPELEESEPSYVMPKRQSGLTFVPGLKRRDFYPAFPEPATHYAAFVPQKRMAEKYADAYQRVMGLAAALRREGVLPMDEEFEGYYKRK